MHHATDFTLLHKFRWAPFTELAQPGSVIHRDVTMALTKVVSVIHQGFTYNIYQLVKIMLQNSFVLFGKQNTYVMLYVMHGFNYEPAKISNHACSAPQAPWAIRAHSLNHASKSSR